VPAQDGVRGEDQAHLHAADFGDEPVEQRDHRAVGPVQLRALPGRRELALQDGELMAQQQDLAGLTVVAATGKPGRSQSPDH
jgi:hypothetical protein